MPVDQSTFAEVTPAERRATKRAKLEQTAYGNYSGYHSRRRLDSSKSTGDPRLALLPADWVDWKRVLDIGCNSGRVTVELGSSDHSLYLGIDSVAAAQLNHADRIE